MNKALNKVLNTVKHEQKRAAIVTTLQLRFNDVPESVIHQIGKIRSFSRLDALFERAVTAQTLDEFDLQ